MQELLRHASSKITMDLYAQARMEDKRRAQLRIAEKLQRPEGVNSRKTRDDQSKPKLVMVNSA